MRKENLAITHVLHAKNGKIYPAYVLKHNPSHENEVNLSMIPNGGRWHYTAIKKLPALLRITSKNHGSSYCLNCFHSIATKSKLNHAQMYVKIMIFVTL